MRFFLILVAAFAGLFILTAWVLAIFAAALLYATIFVIVAVAGLLKVVFTRPSEQLDRPPQSRKDGAL